MWSEINWLAIDLAFRTCQMSRSRCNARPNQKMTPARREWGSGMSDQRKPRGLARFREREVTRITKAVRVAGGGKVTLDPETGRYHRRRERGHAAR